MSSSPTAASPAPGDQPRPKPEPEPELEPDCCDSDGSEVLSVGHEPPPTLADDDLEPLRGAGELEDGSAASRTPSPASSPSAGAASPSRPELAQDASLPRQPASAGPQPPLLGYPPRLAHVLPYGLAHGLAAGLPHALPHHGLVYPSRGPVAVPMVARLSLSPPSAMTVPGGLPGLPGPPPGDRRQQPLGQQGRQPEQQPQPPQHQLHNHNHNQQQQQQQSPQQQQQRPPANGAARRGPAALESRNGSDSRGGADVNGQHQASLKFSIDNILKGDFGRRITDPISLKKSRPKKTAARPIDLRKDYLESSSEGLETTRGDASPRLPASSPAPSATPTSATETSKPTQWPAWVYCTRYSDRPSSGRSPRTRRMKRTNDRQVNLTGEEKRPRTAFSPEQLVRLVQEFGQNKYLNETRRQTLSKELGLNEAQIKIWFQNKRAKIKKASGQKNPLAIQLMAQGLYNHSTVPLSKEEMEQAAELQAK